MAITLIGGTLGGTILTLVFLPALYVLRFRIKPPTHEESDPRTRFAAAAPQPSAAPG